MDWLLLVRIIALLHLLVYIGIMWYGWKSYKILRKRSWFIMGMGFLILLAYRTERSYEMLMVTGVQELNIMNLSDTLTPFVGAVFLLVAFGMQNDEHRTLFQRLLHRPIPRSGELPPDFWRKEFDEAIRRNIKDDLLKQVSSISTQAGTASVGSQIAQADQLKHNE